MFFSHNNNDFLQKAHIGQQMLSGDSYPMLYKAIPALEHLQSEWEALQGEYTEEDPLYHVLKAELDKLGISYLKMESSDAYGTAMSTHLPQFHSWNIYSHFAQFLLLISKWST